jgi:hypothetical protein
MAKIFIQIASYRDPELIPTINDCINKAKYPENLTFGIGWQYGPEKKQVQKILKSIKNLKLIEVPFNESKGLCWMRSEIQKLWNGEDFTLQLDSHHRFIKNWDEELLKMVKSVDSQKPIITSYAGSYNPQTNQLLNTEPYKMVAEKFTESGTILFRPHPIPDYQNLSAPIPARFVSGHFFFTIGEHCREYKYDPELYFAGDEISLSIRSFTLGYDIYHPHKTLIWHEYTREGRIKHWTDFDKKNKDFGIVKKTWFEMDAESKKRLRHLLKEEDSNIDLGIYGLGDVRTHHDYEIYAGINFKERLLHSETKKGTNPPVNDYTDWFKNKPRTFNIKVNLPPVDDFAFIYIAVESKDGEVLCREDLREYKSSVNLKFNTEKMPYKWVFWPVNKDNSWGNRIDTLI